MAPVYTPTSSVREDVFPQAHQHYVPSTSSETFCQHDGQKLSPFNLYLAAVNWSMSEVLGIRGGYSDAANISRQDGL